MLGHFGYSFVHDMSFSCIIDIPIVFVSFFFSVHVLAWIGIQHLCIYLYHVMGS